MSAGASCECIMRMHRVHVTMSDFDIEYDSFVLWLFSLCKISKLHAVRAILGNDAMLTVHAQPGMHAMAALQEGKTD